MTGIAMKRIIILTGSELRQTFFRKYIALSENINVVATYCEGLEKSLTNINKSLSDDLRNYRQALPRYDCNQFPWGSSG